MSLICLSAAERSRFRELGLTESAGRAVFATRRIGCGDLIHTAKPVLACPSLVSLDTVCYLCLKKLMGSAKFEDRGVSYCSKECQENAKGFYDVETRADWSSFVDYCRNLQLALESRHKKDDPVVIWLIGGPGCSSDLAMFYENGPFKITNNMSLAWNEYGWDKPAGTGFSYTTDKSDIRHDENGVSNDLHDFLQAFFAEHPKFAENDFYITGESYAGHYIPAFASRVHRGNKANEVHRGNKANKAIGVLVLLSTLFGCNNNSDFSGFF